MEVFLNYGIGENGFKEIGREDKLESVLWIGEVEEFDVRMDDFVFLSDFFIYFNDSYDVYFINSWDLMLSFCSIRLLFSKYLLLSKIFFWVLGICKSNVVLIFVGSVGLVGKISIE